MTLSRDRSKICWTKVAVDSGRHPQIAEKRERHLPCLAAAWFSPCIFTFLRSLGFFFFFSLLDCQIIFNYPTSWLQFQVCRHSSGAPPELCIERGSRPSTSPHIGRYRLSIRRASWPRRRTSCKSSGNEFRSLLVRAVSFQCGFRMVENVDSLTMASA